MGRFLRELNLPRSSRASTERPYVKFANLIPQCKPFGVGYNSARMHRQNKKHHFCSENISVPYGNRDTISRFARNRTKNAWRILAHNFLLRKKMCQFQARRKQNKRGVLLHSSFILVTRTGIEPMLQP